MTASEALELIINSLHNYSSCGRLTHKEIEAIKILRKYIKGKHE